MFYVYDGVTCETSSCFAQNHDEIMLTTTFPIPRTTPNVVPPLF